MAQAQILTGWKELDENLKALDTRVANRVATSAMRSALTVAKKGIKSAASDHKDKGILDQSINSRFSKKQGGAVVRAKVGVNVGKRTALPQGVARHAHLVALGTKPRVRKKIGGKFAYLKRPKSKSTGVMPSDEFVKQGYAASEVAMQSAMVTAATRSLEREVAKLKK